MTDRTDENLHSILSDAALWVQPSDEHHTIERRITEQIAAEQIDVAQIDVAAIAPQQIAAEQTDVAQIARRPTPMSRLRATPPRPLLLAAALIAVVAMAASLGGLIGDREAHDVAASYLISGGPDAPQATASVEVRSLESGQSISIVVAGLAPAEPDEYYAAWLRSGPQPDAAVVGIGSFHIRGEREPIELWSGVDHIDYPMFMVTRQHVDAPPTPSQSVVLLGPLIE